MFCWDIVLLGHSNVGTFEKKNTKKIFFFLSLLRCGPDNKRTKEKEKTIKIKEKKIKIVFLLNLTFLDTRFAEVSYELGICVHTAHIYLGIGSLVYFEILHEVRGS